MQIKNKRNKKSVKRPRISMKDYLIELGNTTITSQVEEISKLHSELRDLKLKQEPKKYGGSEHQQRLMAKADQISLSAIGTRSNTFDATPIDIRAIVEKCEKIVAAQCLFDGIASSEYGLAIRNIIPRIDLLDGDGKTILDWKTNKYSLNEGPKMKFSDFFKSEKLGRWLIDRKNKRSLEDKLRVSVFTTSKNSDNDRKVICFYGAEIIGSQLLTDSIEFQRGWVKTISIYDATELVNKKRIIFTTPILYKKGDNVRIVYRINKNAINYSDNIRLLGIVGEPLGQYVCG